jgi:4-hydroxy-2-oxoheptanedioate aldolase
MRGVAGLTRASRFGAVPDYTRRADAEICLILQVETALALSRIEEIAATDGVDGLFIGPADLAASMGHPGALDHPAVKAAIKDAILRITATGKPAGILTSDAAFARACMGWGTRFTAVGMDIGLMLHAARGLAASYRSA